MKMTVNAAFAIVEFKKRQFPFGMAMFIAVSSLFSPSVRFEHLEKSSKNNKPMHFLSSKFCLTLCSTRVSALVSISNSNNLGKSKS